MAAKKGFWKDYDKLAAQAERAERMEKNFTNFIVLYRVEAKDAEHAIHQAKFYEPVVIKDSLTKTERARVAGSTSSTQKQRTSRANGRRGGRPKGITSELARTLRVSRQRAWQILNGLNH